MNHSSFFIYDDVPWQDLGSGMKRKIMPWTDDMVAVYVKFDKGAVGKVHKHDNHTQISYVVAGSFEAELGKEKRILKAGDGYLALKNITHGAVALEDGSVIVDFFTPMRRDFVE